MDLFTYLLAKNNKFSLAHKSDLFSYLLGKNNSIPLKTAEGVFITIEALKRKINELKMMKESSQETTTGKQLFDLNNYNNLSSQGITATVNNFTGEITLNGTSTATAYLRFDLRNTISSGSVVSYGGNNTNTMADCFLNLVLNGDTKQVLQLNSQNSKKENITLNTDINRLYIQINNGITLNNFVIKPMLNIGASLSEYELYTGGQPSPNPNYPQEVNVVEGYRNLFDKSQVQTGKRLVDGSNDVYDSASNATSSYIEIQPNTDYYLDNFNAVHCYDENYNVVLNAFYSSNYSRIISTPATAKFLRFSTFITNLDISQLTKSSSALPYVPYGNNYVNVEVRGKNLLSGIEQGTLDSSGQPISSSTAIRSKNFDLVKSNTTYTFSNDGTLSPINVAQYDKNKNFISYTYYNGTFTTSNTTKYVKISKGGSVTDLFQIEQGSVATSYEPYVSTNVQIPLNGNYVAGIGDYKDEIIVDKFGKCYLNKKIGKLVLDGSEDWQDRPNYSYADRFVFGSNIIATQNVKGFSNYFDVVYASTDSLYKLWENTGTQIIINFSEKGTTSLAEFKSWLSTHNTDVYYVLAEENLIDLNYTINLKLFKGINNITNSEDMTMIIKYY